MKFFLNTFCITFLLFLGIQGRSQTLQLANVQACIGDTASLPINMSTIDSVGAITLYISYDTAKVNFITFSNINTLASGTMFNDVKNLSTGARLGKVAISWVTTSLGINFTLGILGIMKFKVVNGGCNLSFLNSCELVKYNTENIIVSYTDGSIAVPSLPIISVQPQQLALNTDQSGSFIIDASGYANIQWQLKQGNIWNNIQNNATFQGVNNDTLIVFMPMLNLNGTNFRCKLTNYCFTMYSDSVILNVALSVDEHSVKTENIYPNPFINKINIDFDASAIVETVNIYTPEAKLLKQINVNSKSSKLIINNLNFLIKGVYYFEIQFKDNEWKSKKRIYKLIKL